jgi:hypothetical protein
MDPRVIGLRARAEEVRRLADAATIKDIRAELLAIAAQYDELADGIDLPRGARADRTTPTNPSNG